jgi:hypothetical protein
MSVDKSFSEKKNTKSETKVNKPKFAKGTDNYVRMDLKKHYKERVYI